MTTKRSPLSDTRIEVGLVVCLEALLIEKSVTRAATRVGITQPGMSNALSRLRRLTGDPLLVRADHGFSLTQRAEELLICVRSGLSMLEEIFAPDGNFNPERADGIFTIAMTDALAVMLGPRVLNHLNSRAAQLEINLQQLDQLTVARSLSEGKCDLAIGYLHTIPDQMYATALLSQGLSVIRASNMPETGARLDLADYLSAKHVFVHGPNFPHAWPDETLSLTLEALGYSRKVGAHVSSILLAPEIVAHSALCCSMPSWLAKRSAEHLPISVYPLPFVAAPVTAHLIWHERTHRRSLHQWVRDSIKSVVAGAAGSTFRSSGPPLF